MITTLANTARKSLYQKAQEIHTGVGTNRLTGIQGGPGGISKNTRLDRNGNEGEKKNVRKDRRMNFIKGSGKSGKKKEIGNAMRKTKSSKMNKNVSGGKNRLVKKQKNAIDVGTISNTKRR